MRAATGFDGYVFLGDYVGYGADPAFVVDTVKDFVARGAVALLGNHDSAVDRHGRKHEFGRCARRSRGRAPSSATRRSNFSASARSRIRKAAGSTSTPARPSRAHGTTSSDADPALRSFAATPARITLVRAYPRAAAVPAFGKRPACGVRAGRGCTRSPAAKTASLAVIGAVGQPRDRQSAGLLRDLRRRRRHAHLFARALRYRYRGEENPRRRPARDARRAACVRAMSAIALLAGGECLVERCGISGDAHGPHDIEPAPVSRKAPRPSDWRRSRRAGSSRSRPRAMPAAPGAPLPPRGEFVIRGATVLTMDPAVPDLAGGRRARARRRHRRGRPEDRSAGGSESSTAPA